MSYILKLLLSVIHNLVIVNTFNTHNYPYNIWGSWHINFLDKNLPKNSVIKIFPSKIEIITTKDILSGVILMEKEYKCKYNLEKKSVKPEIKLNFEKEVNQIHSLLGVELKINKSIKNIENDLKINIIYANSESIVILLNGSINKFTFNDTEVILSKIKIKNNDIIPINILIIGNIIGYTMNHIYDSIFDDIQNLLLHFLDNY